MHSFNEFCLLFETAEANEQLLIRYLASLAEKNKSTKSSTTHIKRVNWQPFSSVADAVNDMIEKLGTENFSVKKADKQIAGSGAKNLIAYLVRCVKEDGFSVDGKYTIPYNTTAYVGIYNKEAGILTKKALSPTNLIDCGISYNQRSLYNSVKKKLSDTFATQQNTEIERTVLYPFLIGCLDCACTGTVSKDYTTNFPKISDTDKNLIGQDLGEILVALNEFNNSNSSTVSVVFPKGNQELVDLEVYDSDALLKRISVKYKDGAPPSIKTLADKLSLNDSNVVQTGISKELSDSFMKFKKILEKMHRNVYNDKTWPDRILEVLKIVDTEKYNAIKNIFRFTDMTQAGINKTFAKLNSEYSKSSGERKQKIQESFLIRYNKFVELIKRGIATNVLSTEEAIEKILYNDSHKDKCGIITSPLGYHIMDILNSDESFITELNNVIRSYDVLQTYVKLTSSGVSFRPTKFKDGTFVLMYNGIASSPSNRGFGFKMK